MDDFSVPQTMGVNNASAMPPVIRQEPIPATVASTPAAPAPIPVTPTFTPAPATPVSEPPPASSVPTAKILLAVIPFFAFVVTGIISYRLINQKQPAKYLSRASETTVSSATSQNLEIAKKTLDWIDKQKNETGRYAFAKYSPESTGGASSHIDNRVGIDVIYARFKYWQRTKDENTLKKLKADLTTYNNRKIVQKIQNSFWNCKLMSEISSEKLLDQASRNMAKRICDRSTSFASRIKNNGPMEENFKPTEFIDDVDLTTAFSQRKNASVPPEINPSDQSLTEYAVFSSDFSAKFVWKKINNYLLIAKSLFNAAFSSYISTRRQADAFIDGECNLGIAALDLYKSTNEEKYLTFAKDLFKEDLIGKISILKKDNASEQISCALFSEQLFRATKDNRYKEARAEMLQTLLINNYDETDGSFVNKFGSSTVKLTRDNAWASVIFGEPL